ncbi:hypothetical protein [Granulicoccus sp. GXG6511]|uniref:hypothetical protein n=1 Tax=Granulicoccus sp. GXG6511 TaxID=3381351 RepID=UPI003D7E21C6
MITRRTWWAVTGPGVFAPAGEPAAGGWALTRSGPVAQTILVRRTAREVPAPTISYA